MKNTVLYIALLLTMAYTVSYGQKKSLEVEAIVVDAETKEPLPFTNIVIKGTYLGTITNDQGKFSLTYNKKHIDKEVIVSYMGYHNMSKNLDDFKKPTDTIYLKRLDNSLNEVIVVGKNKYREMIKEAIRNFSINYPQQSTQLDAYYRELTKVGDTYTKFSDAASRLFYSSYDGGYDYGLSKGNYFKFTRTDQIERVPFPEPVDFVADKRDQVKVVALRKSNNLQKYNILKHSKSLKYIDTSHLKWLENNEIGGGPLRIMGADKVKRKEDFLNMELCKKYQYSLLKKSTFNNLPVYVIRFKPKDSLDAKARYFGEITIDKTSNAIVSYTYQPTLLNKRNMYQKFANQLKVPNSAFKAVKKRFITRVIELLDYKVTVDFSQIDFVWFLKHIRVINNYKNSGDFSKSFKVTTETELVVNNVNTNNISKFSKSEIYNTNFMNAIFNSKLEYDPLFWKTYSELTPTGLMDKAVKDLEIKASLQDQFYKK